MGFSEKADNLKLLPNYSHEHRALLSQMKAPKRSVARLHARRLRSRALAPIDPRKSDFRNERSKLKCESNVIAVVCGYSWPGSGCISSQSYKHHFIPLRNTFS